MKKAHPLNRRDFLKSGLVSLGILVTDGLPVFAVSSNWNPKKKPNLIFGVVSDTHMRCHYDGKRFYSRYDVFYDDQALVEVMKLFKKEGVDAILHCGDVTDNGMVREMEFYKEAWDKVYGTDPRPVNMICTGNHDVDESYYWAKYVTHSIGSPEFPKGAKLEVSLLPRAETQRRGEDGVEGSASLCLRVRIPKADGNPDSRIYGFNVVVAGEDGTKVKKSVYARGYCMGMGYEPDGGVTMLEIPQAELPPGKKLTVAVRPCSSLATRGKPLVTTFNIATGMSKSRKVGA